MNRALLLLTPLAVMVSSVAEAAETGGVRGQVTDESGLPVPGVSVVLSGANIAGERVAVTDDDGNFRLLSLPPGPHELKIRAEGFAPTQYNVVVRLDETAFVPVVLKLAGMATEEIIVEESLPVVDATRSAVSTQMTTELLQNVPTGRSYQSAVNMVAGVSGRVDTQGGGPSTGNPSVRGEGQYGNNYLLDGISTRDPATKTFGVNVNFDAIEEIQVYTDGAPAEFGQATGMLVNVVTKDGSDEHFGSAAAFFELPASGGTYLILDTDTGVEVETTKRKFFNQEYSLTAGGPIVKEKLWYFAAVDIAPSHIEYEATGEDAPYGRLDMQGLAKLTWFVTPDIALQYQLGFSNSSIKNYETSGLYDPDAQALYKSSDLTHIVTARYRPSVMNELELKISAVNSNLDVVPISDDLETPMITDTDSGTRSNNYDSYDFNIRSRIGGSLTFTQLVEDALGDHKVKAGLEFWTLKDSRDLQFTGTSVDGTFDDITAAAAIGTQYEGSFDSSTELNGYEFYANEEYPCEAADYSDCAGYTQKLHVGALGHVGSTFGLFLQDDWRIDPLTFNLGVRVDREQLYQNEGTKILDQWMPAPRLGAAWDVTRDSKTLVSVNAGRYFDINGNGFADWGDTRSSAVWREVSNNGDGTWSVDWVQDPASSPLIYCSKESIAQLRELEAYPEEDLDYIENDVCASYGELKAYHLDKLVVGVKREIIPLFALGVKGIMSTTANLPEDIDTDLDYWVVANSPSKRRDYRALELTAERKYDGVWQLLASYTLSEAKGTNPGQFELASGGQTGSDGNNVGVYLDDINDPAARDLYFEYGYGWLIDGLYGLGREGEPNYYGYLPYPSFHNIKVAGSYTLPFGTTIGAVYEFDSGHAWQRRGFVDLYNDYFAFPEGRGSRLMPAVNYFDLRVAHSIGLGNDREVEVSVDVFNVLDLQAPITYYENDNESFGLTMYRQSPRALRVGANFTY